MNSPAPISASPGALDASPTGQDPPGFSPYDHTELPAESNPDRRPCGAPHARSATLPQCRLQRTLLHNNVTRPNHGEHTLTTANRLDKVPQHVLVPEQTELTAELIRERL